MLYFNQMFQRRTAETFEMDAGAGGETTFLYWLVLLGLVILMYLMVRLLHLASPSATPVLTFKDSHFSNNIIKACPLLHEPYVPPLIWGKSGHMQTIIYGKLGRVKSPFPRGERVSIVMPDGATMTYDIFEPLSQHPSEEDVTIAICPGLANSSESVYIRTCVDYAQNKGYRVAVLNHIGAIKSIKLTAPRIFSYGDSEEYGMMIDDLHAHYPHTKLIAIGFSMGANIVLKYLGENPDNEKKVIAAMSFCQGYDIEMGARVLTKSWSSIGQLYLFAMTTHQKGLIFHHKDQLFTPETVERYGCMPDINAIKAALLLRQLDEAYSSKRAGFASTVEYYKWASSIHYMKNITVPTLLLNALDDPIVPAELLKPARELAKTKENMVLVETQHGGHLGYFEGNLFVPESITWLDKVVMQFADAIVTTLSKTK